MADAPSFSIDNSFESEQTYIPGDWNVVDTYNQVYTLDWAETYSSRLAVQVTFDLEMEDIIRSLDVDEKHVTPSFELDLTGLVWDLNFLVQDTIDYSNEFNTPRKDALEFGLDLDLSPLYLPPLKAQLQRLVDTQDNLEDKVERKLDVSSDYSFSEFFDVDMSWIEDDTDDRLFDNNDISSHEWDFNFNYNQAMTPTFKVDFQSGLSGRNEETRNNAGTLLLEEKEHDFAAALKFTLDTFPDFTSDLEITRDRDFVESVEDDEITFTAEYIQTLIDLGTLTETIDLGRSTVSSPIEDTLEDNFEFTIELAGTPYKYADYSIKYDYTIDDLKDDVTPANDNKSVGQEFDLSVTLTPNEKITLDTSYNWSSTKDNGTETGSDNTFKIEGVFDGELLDVPNLTFTPLLEISTEKDYSASIESDIFNLELDFLYVFVMPRNISWEIETVYSWNREDGNLTRELELDSDLDIDYITSSWEFNFVHSATTTINYDTDDADFWDHDFTIGAIRELTPRIFFDVEYNFEYSGDAEDSDDFETNLEWRGNNSSLVFKVIKEMVFEGPKDVIRTYEAEFTMEF
ncbi:MAG: hypothetical protein P1S59_08405 [bacterium]|nr:hypothetical protein [bacterium]